MDASSMEENYKRFLASMRDLCQRDDPNWQSKTQEQETFSVVYQVYESLGLGDMDLAAGLLSEDAEFIWHGDVTHPFVAHVVGRASVMQKIITNYGLMQQQDTTVKYLAVQASTLCLGMYEFGVFRPTGMKYYGAGMMVFTVEHQQIRRCEWFGAFDSALLRKWESAT